MEAVQNLLKPLSILGVGSVPFVQGENTCEQIFKEWDIPFWPQYPKRSCRENFVFQFLEDFPGLHVSEKEASFEEKEFLSGASEYQRKLDEISSRPNLLFFEPSTEWALGYNQMRALLDERASPEKRVVKLQITGLETVWKSFFVKKVSKAFAKQTREILALTLTARGLAQIERVLSSDRVPLIFIDEPFYSEELDELRGMAKRFKRAGAQVGIHLCSNVHWAGLETLGLDFFHFDLTNQEKWSESNRIFIQNLLKDRTWVVWGVVPTHPITDFKIRDFSSMVLDSLNAIFKSPGSVNEVLPHSLLASSCGTGTLDSSQGETIFQSLQQTAQSLKVFLQK